MANILILFAHPRLENSRINRFLIDCIPAHANITFCDLYEQYPDFNIPVQLEKELLLRHDVIVWMHPLYWYSSPPLLKQWIDMVLEFGWAYGPGGQALSGKYVFNAISTGGGTAAYRADGNNKYTLNEFLRPFEQTARLCKMLYLPPFAVQGTHRLPYEELESVGITFQNLLLSIAEDQLDLSKAIEFASLNQFFDQTEPSQ